ncbi:hypothetical protein R1flu_015147 [Riccia fluitans]|uniref:Uncharacterized protein n=1 Tax=Riccia fluitans TaxID=41844 RepID=A0ABD1YI39_9MARC
MGCPRSKAFRFFSSTVLPTCSAARMGHGRVGPGHDLGRISAKMDHGQARPSCNLSWALARADRALVGQRPQHSHAAMFARSCQAMRHGLMSISNRASRPDCRYFGGSDDRPP